ncbi:hypothetical protein BU23DRAFT_579452 [Bimuria novae-zelandiae CBS 107.79]|uniref:F-box domain-containing protein n=1 Tax=Bimuria novae-zelandiae CBS 107.79 TaxID=1447943 RepID=A0A6A5VP69_9PLEO|nr:hypothetical protein BU23DRAFT_579452 [Bimuria novae-zelandiae CBS 107.79]
MVTPSSSKLIDGSFPAELLLEVIENIPFGDGSDIFTLSRVHPRIADILRSYEQSLTGSFARKELRHAAVDFPTKLQGFKWLRTCVKQYDVIDDVMATLVDDHNVFPVRKHNMALINTGLLLLYHLQSFGPHTAKLTLLKSLPKDPLTTMYLAVHYATLTARYHGEGLIHQRTYGQLMDANTLSFRSDIEFCFAEASLQLGPDFVHSTLLADSSTYYPSERILLNFYHDHAIHDWVLESDPGGSTGFQPPITQGPKKQGAIEEDAAAKDHSLAWLDLEGKETLMKGGDVVS